MSLQSFAMVLWTIWKSRHDVVWDEGIIQLAALIRRSCDVLYMVCEAFVVVTLVVAPLSVA